MRDDLLSYLKTQSSIQFRSQEDIDCLIDVIGTPTYGIEHSLRTYGHKTCIIQGIQDTSLTIEVYDDIHGLTHWSVHPDFFWYPKKYGNPLEEHK